MTPGDGEFVDRLGLYFETVGGTRTMGRIYGWLMICDPPHQSLTEMAAELEVSKVSISTVVRQLHDGGMVERVPAPGRQHHYRITPGGWTQVIKEQVKRARFAVEAAEAGLSSVGTDRSEQRERLQEFRDFFAFMEADTDEFIQRWERYRARRASTDGQERGSDEYGED